MPDRLVVDASAIVDLLAGTELAGAVATRLRGCALHAPGHVDAEVLSALGRLRRADLLSEAAARVALEHLSASNVERHVLPPLLAGAWNRGHNLRLVDALYVELGVELGATVITTDGGMAAADSLVELVSASP